MTYVLGISAYYHDSAAALLRNGQIVAAAQEERFTRKKADSSFPAQAIKFCLAKGGIALNEVSTIVFYDKPMVTFERILETYLAIAPRGFKSFLKSMPVWLKEKLHLRTVLKRELAKLASIKTKNLPPIHFTEHHHSHACSAFFPSPFHKSAVLCIDGVGEWATTSAWKAEGNQVKPLWQMDFPHSLGLLYSAFTYYTGFKVNSGEYKVMGLAPYGNPKYVQLIYDHLMDLKKDGTFRLNMKYFNFLSGLTMVNEKFCDLMGGPARRPESQLTQKEMDLASSIQVVTEEVVLRLATTLFRETGDKNLCLAGGVALNCVNNGRLLREGPFERIWIQPAAGDAGGALGAAFAEWYQWCKNPRGEGEVIATDSMKGSFLGPSFSQEEIEEYLKSIEAPFERFVREEDLLDKVSQVLSEGSVVGWFQGPMEYGPRALGRRSILGDARNPEMQTKMNLKIKYRESFRPFAPVVPVEDVAEYFDSTEDSPYMLFVASVNEELRLPLTREQRELFGIEKLKVPRSKIPAVTHVDYSARIQTVHPHTNPRLHRLLKRFKSYTGCSVLVNTSFNVRGEPIVCDPEDAYRCFLKTEMDYLVLENLVLEKSKQPSTEPFTKKEISFELD